MKKWVKRIGFGALVLVLVIVFGTFTRFMFWRQQHNSELLANSVLVDTPRGPIEYAELGQGTPMLLIHGTPGGYDQLRDIIKATGKVGNGLRYIMPSRPGYLRTPLTVGATPQEQAQAYAALLTKLGVEKVLVAATSGGGPSGLQFALQYPDRCMALILIETVSRQWAAPVESVKASLLQDYLIWLFGRFQVAKWQASNPADRDISIIGQNGLNSIQPSELRFAGEDNDLKQFSQMSDFPLNRIRCPTLILHGTADVNVPIAQSEYAHAQIANSELVTFPGEDHFMVITKRKELDKVIAKFVAKHATK